MTVTGTTFTGIGTTPYVGKIGISGALFLTAKGLPDGSTGAGPARSDMILNKQNTAISVRVLMKGTDSGKGVAGLTLTTKIAKGGASTYTTITPAVTDMGSGIYMLALTTGHMDTLGLANFHISAPGAFDNDELVVDVIAIDKTDAVRLGLTSLPNANAGANTGLPVVGTQVPNANAGANNGLPTVGAQIPNAAAGAANGLISFGTGAGQLNVASGKADAQVKGMDADTLTNTALATSAVTEMQAGLATSADVATIEADVAAVAAAAATAVWATVIEGTHNAAGFLRMLLSVSAGPATGVGTGSTVWKSINGAVNRVQGTIVAGVRTITGLIST